MPLPKPRKNEAQNEFISRCMASDVIQNDFPNQKQRVAVCFSQWKTAKKKQKMKASLEEPKWEDCEKEIKASGVIIVD